VHRGGGFLSCSNFQCWHILLRFGLPSHGTCNKLYFYILTWYIIKWRVWLGRNDLSVINSILFGFCSHIVICVSVSLPPVCRCWASWFFVHL
jgi:hypothetical protein